MKVFFDYQIFQHQVYGGISKYFYELIKGIEKQPNVRYQLPLLLSSNGYIKNIEQVSNGIVGGSDFYHQFLGNAQFPGKWKLYQAKNRFFPGQALQNQDLTIRYLKEQKFDLFHPTDNDDYFLKYIGSKPFIITIHDLIDEIFPEYGFHVHSTYKTSVKENLIKKASGIIAVSQSTKKDIIDRFNVEESKIKVIHHGITLNESVQSTRAVEGDYFLFVGKRTHYKNFYFFLQCIKPFLKDDANLKVICVGSKFNSAEKAYYADLGISEQINHIDADDLMLDNLYHNAIAFVYPSLYEGFGMPVLEAFKNECPVLLSNTSSLPEVAGDAALYFDPKNLLSVRSALTQILFDSSLRNDLIKKGTDRLRKFSWDKTVGETLAFYRTLI